MNAIRKPFLPYSVPCRLCRGPLTKRSTICIHCEVGYEAAEQDICAWLRTWEGDPIAALIADAIERDEHAPKETGR